MRLDYGAHARVRIQIGVRHIGFLCVSPNRLASRIVAKIGARSPISLHIVVVAVVVVVVVIVVAVDRALNSAVKITKYLLQS